MTINKKKACKVSSNNFMNFSFRRRDLHPQNRVTFSAGFHALGSHDGRVPSAHLLPKCSVTKEPSGLKAQWFTEWDAGRPAVNPWLPVCELCDTGPGAPLL